MLLAPHPPLSPPTPRPPPPLTRLLVQQQQQRGHGQLAQSGNGDDDFDVSADASDWNAAASSARPTTTQPQRLEAIGRCATAPVPGLFAHVPQLPLSALPALTRLPDVGRSGTVKSQLQPLLPGPPPPQSRPQQQQQSHDHVQLQARPTPRLPHSSSSTSTRSSHGLRWLGDQHQQQQHQSVAGPSSSSSHSSAASAQLQSRSSCPSPAPAYCPPSSSRAASPPSIPSYAGDGALCVGKKSTRDATKAKMGQSGVTVAQAADWLDMDEWKLYRILDGARCPPTRSSSA